MAGIPLLIDRLGEVLDSAVIPMGVVTCVKVGFFFCSLGDNLSGAFRGRIFDNSGGTLISGVWASTSVGSGVGATLISSAGMIVIGSLGADVGTTLGSESGMVIGKCDLGGAVDCHRIWATWMKEFLIVEPKVSSECFSVGDCRILNMSSAVCLR